jgi:hypothetical protein
MVSLTKLIIDTWISIFVNCLYCGHVYVAHELEKNKDKLNSVLEVGKCLIMGCNVIVPSMLTKLKKLTKNYYEFILLEIK